MSIEQREHGPASPAEAAAEKLYNPNLPYHNYEHAFGAAAIGVRICRQAELEGVDINAEVVYYALLFHDAGYHEDAPKEYPSKEAYSAELARQNLTELKVDEAIISRVIQAILATHKDAIPLTNEDKVVRLADIYNVGGDYATFLANSRNLHTEYEQMNNTTISWEDFKAKQIVILEAYLAHDLSVMPSDHDAEGNWIFRQHCLENIEQYKLEPA